MRLFILYNLQLGIINFLYKNLHNAKIWLQLLNKLEAFKQLLSTSMTQGIDILEELQPVSPKKPKYFTILIYTFFIYIFEVLIFSFAPSFNFNSQIKSIEWEVIFLILVLPVVGLILFLGKIKMGWVICLFYYSALSIFLSTTFFQIYLKKGADIFNIQLRWRGYLLALTAIFSVCLLLSKKIRDHFDIKQKSFVTTLIICIALILTFFFVMYS
jgi:hypothetical protein